MAAGVGQCTTDEADQRNPEALHCNGFDGFGNSGSSGLASGLGIPTEMPDLDGYVTHKALDGLFLKIAEQEKLIRSNPVARTTDLLKSVFGSLKTPVSP